MKIYEDDCAIIKRHVAGDKFAAYDLWRKYEHLQTKYWHAYKRGARGLSEGDFTQEMYIHCVQVLNWCKLEKIGPGYVLQNFIARRAWGVLHDDKKRVSTCSLSMLDNEGEELLAEEISKSYNDVLQYTYDKIIPEVYKIEDVKTRDVVLGILHGKGTREQSRDFAKQGIKISYARLHQRYMKMKDWLYNLIKNTLEEASCVQN
jgi:hypothetical protein